METINDSIIKEQLTALLNERYHLSIRSLNSSQWDIPLTSNEIGLTDFELAQLFFEVEKIYGKSFEANVLKNYGFCTINNIAKAILSP